MNIDWIARVSELPRAGETVAANGLEKLFGGKGANQAIAAARQGAYVRMLGCVGDDVEGQSYKRHLRREGIRTTGIQTARQTVTGTAFIGVDSSAENLIMVAAGANGKLTATMIRRDRRAIEHASVLLLQFESPRAAVVEAIRIANAAGVQVLLNPSPWSDGFPWGRVQVDCLIVNEHEAQSLLGGHAEQLICDVPSSDYSQFRGALRPRGIRTLVITRGSRSTLCLSEEEIFSVPCLRVQPIDTVGAGDAFAGTLAAGLADNISIRDALALANCAGALATLKAGAQDAIPTRAATSRALKGLKM